MKTTATPDPNNNLTIISNLPFKIMTPIDGAPQIFQNIYHCFREFFREDMICFQELSAANLTVIKKRNVCEIYIKLALPNKPHLLKKKKNSLSHELNCLKGFGGGYFYH